MSRFRPNTDAVRILMATMLLAFSMLALAAPASQASRVVDRPLNADLVGVFAFGACPVGAPLGALCLHDRVSGEISSLGSSTGEFDVVIDTAATGADGCAPANKNGFFVVANGDRLDVTAQGRYCFATSVASYTFSVLGGSGSLAGTTGTGTWLVPPPNSLSASGGEGEEYLRGTITYPRRGRGLGRR
jgi:hypothetical protein